MERIALNSQKNQFTGSLPISLTERPAKHFHQMLLDLSPEGYDLKRISVFENPIRANLEFLKTQSKKNSVFELEVSLTPRGDELVYNIGTAKGFWRRKTDRFKDVAEEALKKVVYG